MRIFTADNAEPKVKAILGIDSTGFHRTVYYDWDSRSSTHIVICVHGLSRNGRDFDFLARELARSCRVICPDIAGRGQSDWLENKSDYNYPVYLSDMTALLARLSSGSTNALNPFAKKRIDWVGTSMGGLIGMMLAARPYSPIRRLIINDIGAVIPKAALERISLYLGKDPRFANFEQFETYLRQISATFGPLTNEQWRHLATHSFRHFPDGGYGFKYDPGIAFPFQQQPLQDLELWSIWDAIKCPVLVIRGAESDLLLPDTLAEMVKRKPKTRVVELAGIGHAPTLMAADQIAIVKKFLLS